MAGELKIDVRRSGILDLLRRDGQVRVAALSDALGVSAVTIRSDLDALEREGYLERTQGGAIQTMKNYYNLDFQRRKLAHIDAKKAIARATADLVHDGDTLFINSGTTTYLTAVELKRRKNLNVVTNSISVAIELGDVPSFRIRLLGGEINALFSFTYGESVKEELGRFRADWAILSIDGVCPDAGLTTYHAEEGAVDRIMMERASKTMIVADSSKLGHESFCRIADPIGIYSCVTDSGADRALVQRLTDCGMSVYLV